MPAALSILSQSSLQDYVDCPRRFQLRYLEQLSYPAVESEPALENERHIQEGEYFHRLVQQYFVGIPPEQIARLANTPTLQKWWENFLRAKDLSGLRDLKGLYPEISLSAPLGNIRLLAKYDLIAVRDGQATIFDWKTHRKRPSDRRLSEHMQTRVYPALLVQAGVHLNGGQPFAPEQIEMVYWFADFPDQPAHFPYSAAHFQRDWDLLTRLADEVLTLATYPLTEEAAKCQYCSYRSYCERGAQAGDLDQAEAELESEALFDVNFEQVGEIEF